MRKRASAAGSTVAHRHSAPIFAALGDSTRLWLVDRLSGEGPLSITELTSGAKVTRQAITKHLHVLSEARLVRSTRAGRETLWELTPDQLRDARHFLDDVSSRWDDALERLRAHVEEEP